MKNTNTTEQRSYNVIIDGDRIPGFTTYTDALAFAQLYTDTARLEIRSDEELADEVNEEAAALAA